MFFLDTIVYHKDLFYLFIPTLLPRKDFQNMKDQKFFLQEVLELIQISEISWHDSQFNPVVCHH